MFSKRSFISFVAIFSLTSLILACGSTETVEVVKEVEVIKLPYEISKTGKFERLLEKFLEDQGEAENIDEIRSIFEFLVSKKVSSDVTEVELINMIKTEIQYVNKKMSMARSVSQVSVEDIVLKTK